MLLGDMRRFTQHSLRSGQVLKLILFLSLPGLTVVEAGEEIRGTISYFKDADFSGRSRIIEIDGEHILARATLEYHSMPAGVMDGDGGTLLHLRIKAPGQLQEGRTYVVNQDVLEARVAQWASPHHYQVMPHLKGHIVVRKYVRFHLLLADVDIQYGEPALRHRGVIRFENHDFWRRFKGSVDWEAYDPASSRSRTNIRLDDILGSWKAVDMLQESNGAVLTLIDRSIDPQRFLDVAPDDLKRSASLAREKFKLKENRIHVETNADQKRVVTGVINRLTPDELIVTWTEAWIYEGKDFRSRHRLVYTRTAASVFPR